MDKSYKNKVVLVTGGAGSIGSQLVRKLLGYEPKIVRALDHNEGGLFNLDQELQSPIFRPFIGDIRDKERLKRAMDGADIVFHAAALKHVPLCEYSPFEALQTNVVGTQNVIDAALEMGVAKVVSISTDKAVNPVNVMGATKLMAERLVTAANYYKGTKKTILSSVRFGNVLRSGGSVIPLFEEQIKKGGPVTLTSKKMTRFFMALPEAVGLILKAAAIMRGGEIFILKMPVLRLIDLTKVLIEELAPRYGQDPKKIEIKVIGVRPGEKMHEALFTKEEAVNMLQANGMFVIYSPLMEPVSKGGNVKPQDYSSENIPPLNAGEIRKLLHKHLDGVPNPSASRTTKH